MTRPAFALLLALALPQLGAVVRPWPAAAAEEAPLGVTWLSYRGALAAAREQERPVLLYFRTWGCEECATLEREVFDDRRVVAFLHLNFASAAVDGSRLPTLARKYGLDTYPTLWFLDPRGKALTRLRGEVPVEKALDVMKFVASRAYEKMSFDTWRGVQPR